MTSLLATLKLINIKLPNQDRMPLRSMSHIFSIFKTTQFLPFHFKRMFLLLANQLAVLPFSLLITISLPTSPFTSNSSRHPNSYRNNSSSSALLPLENYSNMIPVEPEDPQHQTQHPQAEAAP